MGSDRMGRSKLLIINKKWVKRETENSVWYVGRTQETLVMSDLKEWDWGVKTKFHALAVALVRIQTELSPKCCQLFKIIIYHNLVSNVCFPLITFESFI